MGTDANDERDGARLQNRSPHDAASRGTKPENAQKSPIMFGPPPWDGYRAFYAKAQGHHLHFLPGGPDRLKALLEMIEAARSTIRMCFYIFDPDRSGRIIRDALIAAVRRGVDAHIIVDSFGARVTDRFFEEFIAAGGRFEVFSPKWSHRYLIRNHQKLVIVDGARVMIGGFNIADDYFAAAGSNAWHDLAIEIKGPVVEDFNTWFKTLENWIAGPDAKFRDISKHIREWDPGSGTVRLLIGGPVLGLSSWSGTIRRDLIAARRLDMVMAYFSPAFRLVRRIANIAKRGTVRLIMAGKSDNTTTVGATRSIYSVLLRQNIELWEFRASKLHTKLIVVDDSVYLGSGNFDMRGLYLNIELMMRIEDRKLADLMREFISKHLPASEKITKESHRRSATLWKRFRWRLSWALVTVLDYNVSRRLNLRQ